MLRPGVPEREAGSSLQGAARFAGLLVSSRWLGRSVGGPVRGDLGTTCCLPPAGGPFCSAGLVQDTCLGEAVLS